MRIEIDATNPASCQVARIRQATAAPALDLLAGLARHEDAALPPEFAVGHPGHGAMLSYLASAPAGHWHLGLSAGPIDPHVQDSGKVSTIRKRPASWQPDRPMGQRADTKQDALLGLVSGFLIPDPHGRNHMASTRPGSDSSPQPGPNPALFVNSLVIRHDLRGRGLGARALQLVGKLAAARGAQRAYVAISLHNPSAREFYRRQGAKPCDLCYWSLSDHALHATLADLDEAPTPLYRSQIGGAPGLQSLRGLAGPPLDLGFGFDFGLARYEAWLHMAPSQEPKEQALAYATALRQLRIWLREQLGETRQIAPRLGVTGLAASLPYHCDPVEASVWALPLAPASA